MNETNKLVKNFTSSATWNILGQAISFFVLMYLPRVLGPEGYGIFNFAQSYVIYFLLFCDLGLSLYCVREVNQNEEKESIINKIYSVKFYLSIISTIIYFISVFFINKTPMEKQTLYAIGLSVLFTGITIDYLFNALSSMKYVGISVAIKNIVFAILCFLVIKHNNQVWLVALFYSISMFSATIFLNFKFRNKYFELRINWIKLKDFAILKKALPLAISLFMVQINNNFDIIYLSFTKTQKEVGYYSAPYKIINFLIAVLCIYFNAAYPSIASLLKNSKKKLNEFITKFYSIGITFATPVVFGGLALSDKIINLLFGVEYAPSKILFSLLMPLIIIRMVTSTFGAVLMMGEGSKSFSKGVILGAILNIIMNIILVPKYGAEGSAVATLLSESLQGIYLFYYFNKYCNFNIIKSTVKPLVSSLIMYIFLIKIYNINLFFSIILGCIIYFVSIIIINFMIRIKNN